jgi:hypothetical protein
MSNVISSCRAYPGGRCDPRLQGPRRVGASCRRSGRGLCGGARSAFGADRGPIQAGCSFNATQLPAGPVGTIYRVSCPSGCETTGGLWGTDVYTADSSICRAGIHAGAIPAGGGVVEVQTQPGRPAYRGSPRNGTVSGDWGAFGASYAVLMAGGPVNAPAPAPPSPPSGSRPAGTAIEAGCSYNGTQIEEAIGTTHVVSCPPGCATSGGVWGNGRLHGRFRGLQGRDSRRPSRRWRRQGGRHSRLRTTRLPWHRAKRHPIHGLRRLSQELRATEAVTPFYAFAPTDGMTA